MLLFHGRHCPLRMVLTSLRRMCERTPSTVFRHALLHNLHPALLVFILAMPLPELPTTYIAHTTGLFPNPPGAGTVASSLAFPIF
jgi:hypothetical protein